MFLGPRFGIAFFGLLFFATLGCGPEFGLPRICDPRPESVKLAEARKFDPYPDPSVGGDMRGARPLGFMDPRPDPDLLAKQQMAIPSNVVVTPGPPGSLPPPPAVYIPPAPSYAPGTVVPPPGTSAGNLVPATSTPQIIYPAAGAPYLPGGTSYAVAPAAYSASTPTSYAGPTTSAPATANTAASPAAYGKALGSP